MLASIESRVPYLDHKLIEEAWNLNEEHFISNSVTKYPLREGMSEYIPVHVRNAEKKFQRPGRDAYLVYNHFKKNIIDFLSTKDPLNILNNERCLKKYREDVKNDNVQAAGLWFRIFTYLIWANQL